MRGVWITQDAAHMAQAVGIYGSPRCPRVINDKMFPIRVYYNYLPLHFIPERRESGVSYMCTHTHTHTHTRINTHIQTHTQTQMAADSSRTGSNPDWLAERKRALESRRERQKMRGERG